MHWLRPMDITASTTSQEIWRDAARRGALSGLLFGLLMGAGSGVSQGIAVGVFFGLFMGVFFAWDLARHRRRARKAPQGRVQHRPRPAYMPSLWHDREADHWSMRTPLRALLTFAIPGTIAAVLLFWRIVSPASFANPDGSSNATLLIVAPLMLGFCWVFGLRAWRAHRDRG